MARQTKGQTDRQTQTDRHDSIQSASDPGEYIYFFTYLFAKLVYPFLQIVDCLTLYHKTHDILVDLEINLFEISRKAYSKFFS